ncbi:MAG TPA: response regulator [Candidatus Angelobacter sp.]
MSTIPTVYFIDDSATMREVIKIAFRRENIHVVACQDAASALGEIEKAKPDVVITDVIMPDKDGYEVCQHIKNHPALSRTPVILMSGVVNRAVAEKAFAVKADELLRKPFQPQDLITRVKHLLKPNGHPAPSPAAAASAAAALSTIFSAASAAQPARPAAPATRSSFTGAAVEVPPAQPVPISAPRLAPAVAQVPAASQAAAPVSIQSAPAKVYANGDIAKLKLEILRLEGLVKKLQSELVAEREYAQALEAHIKTLQEAE